MREDDLPGRVGELLRYGTVDSVDHATGKMVVRVGELLTAPVRWFHGASGATSSWSPPSIGEQVMLLAPEGDIAGAIALRGVHSDAHPPAGNSARELVRFADGAVVAYDPDGHKLEAVLPAGAIVSIVAPGGVTIEADVRIKGDVEVEGRIHATGDVSSDGDVKAGSISLRHHKHLQVATGTAVSGEPQP